MLGVLMGRLGMGGSGAKSTTGLAAVSFFRWWHRSARSLEMSAKYGMVRKEQAPLEIKLWVHIMNRQCKFTFTCCFLKFIITSKNT
jgi:hypothetical protein